MRDIIFMTIVFCEGVVVAGGISAFITILDIVPRMCQVSGTYSKVNIYHYMIIIGSILGSYFYFSQFSFELPKLSTVFIGAAYGIFVGFMAAGLAEALDVIPVVERRLKITGYIKYVLYAIVFGKVAGSIMQWIAVYKLKL